MKLVVYRRQTLALDGHTIHEEGEECVKTVIVKAGQAPGAKLRYKGEGNEQFKRPSTDLVVTLTEDKATDIAMPPAHAATVRKGNDLIYTCKISLQQALKAEPAEILTLDGRLLKVPIDHLITPKTVIRIEGEGMPILKTKKDDPLDP